MRIAAQKYGAMDITSSAAFREQAARAAARLGIQVRDADLQKVWPLEREALQPKHPKHPPGRGDVARNTGKTDRPDSRPGRSGKE